MLIRQSLTIGLNILKSSHIFFTLDLASREFFAFTTSFNTFAVLTDLILLYWFFKIKS